MKKNKVLAILLSFSTLLFSGCAKVINTEQKQVEVTVVDSYYHSAYVTPVRAGKVTTFMHHPATYKIYVNYNDVQYALYGSEIYYFYKDKIGQKAIGTLEVKYYDNGNIKQNIIALQGE